MIDIVSKAAGAANNPLAFSGYEITKEYDKTKVTDRAKLSYQREKLQSTLSEEARSALSIKSPVLFFLMGKSLQPACIHLRLNSKGSFNEEYITHIEEPKTIFFR